MKESSRRRLRLVLFGFLAAANAVLVVPTAVAGAQYNPIGLCGECLGEQGELIACCQAVSCGGPEEPGCDCHENADCHL